MIVSKNKMAMAVIVSIATIQLSITANATDTLIGGFEIDDIKGNVITIKRDTVTWVGGFHNNHFTLLDVTATENYKLWVMQSWAKGKYTKSSKGTPVRSMKMYFQLDCDSKRIKPIQGIMYSDYFGQGHVIGYSGEANWMYVPPGTTSQYILENGCSISKNHNIK